MADVRREDHLVAGEFIAPNASQAAQDFIVTARALMYDEKSEEAVKTALTGTKNLADGVVPFLAMTIQGLQQKLGELSPTDLMVVAIHLAGSMVDLAKDLGDPDAKKGEAEKIAQRVVEMMAKNPQGAPQGQPQGAPPQGGPMPQPQGPPPGAQPLLAGMMPQGIPGG